MSTPLLVLFGSQTGNAQDVAERVAREAKLRGFVPRVLAMDAYPVQRLPEEHAVVLVAATAGQGDAPDNMRSFWKFLLRKNLPADSLAAMRYAVFGLGDSGYIGYNVVAKKLDRRLQGLGARAVLERGLGDDQHPSGYEAALDPWLTKLWRALRDEFPMPAGVPEPIVDEAALLQLGSPRYHVEVLQDAGDHCQPAIPADSNGHSQQQQKQRQEQWLLQEAMAAAAAFRAVAAEAAGMEAPPSTASSEGMQANGAVTPPTYGPWRPFMAPILKNQRLTAPTHFQDTRHIEFDISGSGLSYAPGDLLAVFPRTPADAVDAVLERCGLEGGARVRVTASHPPADAGRCAEVVTTARVLVQGVLDIVGASPRRYFFQVLQHFATAPLERERLAYFATAAGRDDLYRYNQRERRSLLEVLSDFPSAAPPLEWLLEAAPHLQPRLFSLASSPSAHPGTAHILAAVVSYATPTRRLRRGLCTSWLAGLQPGDAVPVWVDKGCLRMPASPGVPLLLVGPGTGVAPFRSFLHERAAWLAAARRDGSRAGVGAAESSGNGRLGHLGSRDGAGQAESNGGGQPSLVGSSGHAGAGAADGISSISGGDVSTANGIMQPLGSSLSATAVQAANGHRSEGGAAGDASPVPAPSMLFFGCRSAAGDHYYAQEWRELQRAGALSSDSGLVVAFSRDGPSKVYVTHALREHGAAVWRLLAAGGAVYVSGSAQKMPAGVAAALEEVAVVHGGLTPEGAAAWLRRLQLGGRYHVEAWS